VCYIYNGQSDEGKTKNTSPAAKSIFFCKRITVNEASAHDKDQALDCYRMVYDLTADEDVGIRISGFSS
jgi:hypothetical protein